MRSFLFTTALCLVVTATALVLPTSLSANQDVVLRSSDGGEVRALIIGIDAYRHVRPLQGAVADAQDLEAALRRMGTRDVTVLIDAQADRGSVLMAIDRLVARARPRDLVFFSIAGHGTQEPERVKGSQPDGMENVFLLPGFELTASGSQQRILGREFNHFIKQFELIGAKVMFVADTCHGGGMTRDVDPRAGEMSFRQVAPYRLTEDTLKPVTTSATEYLNELDFDRTVLLAAVDRKTKSPEIRIPGISTLRGALSYAVARAIEGNADADKNGKITLNELFSNVRQVVYQLSDQRQNIVTMASPGRDLNRDVAYEMMRGISVIEVAGTPGQSVPTGGMTNAPAFTAAAPTATPPAAARQTPTPGVTPSASAAPRTDRPVRIASLDGKGVHFSGLLKREAAFEVVQPIDNPDLVWDPTSRDVLAWGDVVAYGLEKSDLPSVIDRAAAIRELKQISITAPQVIKVGPDDSLHRNASLVHIEVSNVTGRALVLFNIAGDGTVQMLYPIGSDPTVIQDADIRFPVRVREPFGADQLVAITSAERMPKLQEALIQLNRRRAAAQIVKMMQALAPPDARIGSVGLYTAP